MTPYEARFEVVHDCPYSALTARHPKASIVIWCNSRTHIVEVASDSEETLDNVEAECKRLGHEHLGEEKGGNVRLFMRPCDCVVGESIHYLIDDAGCYFLPPAVFAGGKEHYHILAESKEDINELVRLIEKDKGKVELVSMQPLCLRGMTGEQMVSATSLLAGMSERQVKALTDALREGYFDEPAKVDIDHLAKNLGVSRSTFAEHLRKGEAKVMRNLYPVIKMADETGRRGKGDYC
ncbi:MAG: helix-turn-helix domain-containing protein [Methanomassiliicoccales archaeon]|nr:helix-turn-helix domain-containing protein [Methanomassiliicoccales archaeon]